MTNISVIACGNCVYDALWLDFPPTASWVIIIPCWFLVLSFIRTWTGISLSGIPPIYIAIPLVFIVFLIAPGMIGPPLGFWIPVCCIIGTWKGFQKNRRKPTTKTLLAVTVVTILMLVTFGAHDYYKFSQMPKTEMAKFLPVWERNRN